LRKQPGTFFYSLHVVRLLQNGRSGDWRSADRRGELSNGLNVKHPSSRAEGGGGGPIRCNMKIKEGEVAKFATKTGF
jgi:hypothetical protein